MAKVCVQCDKKIGLFKSAVDGIYCSTACRDAGQASIAQAEQRAEEQAAESVRASQREQTLAAEAAEKARAVAEFANSCPKCRSPWSVVPGGGTGGLHAGKCSKCSLDVEFSNIEPCPSCRQVSLIVEADGARCPTCKYRRH